MYRCLLLFSQVFLIVWSVAAQPAEKPGPQKPNIIFVLTDDQRWDALGVAGNAIIQTPNLDRLARHGTLFRHACVTTSICCVSRASLLSGQYESRHKINDFETDFSQQALQNTYPFLLKKAGYTIGFIGKYGVGNHPPAKYFDYWSCTEKSQPDYILTDKSGATIHNTDSVAHDVRIFLDKFGTRGPFCLSIGFKAPHEQDGDPPRFITQERFNHLYTGVTIPEPLTADPKYWNSFPDFFRTDDNIARKRWKPLFSTPEKFQETVKNYYRLVTGVDEAVGKIMQQLRDLRIENNTIIIFMGDNGFCLGEHGLEGKWYGFEESIRVPLIIYDPRAEINDRNDTPLHFPRAGNRDDLALNIDIAPTILSLAAVKIPPAMQGKNLAGLVDGAITRKDFFYEHTFLKSPQLPQVEGVVARDFKYMKYIEHNDEELYDLKNDPRETTNLAHDKRYAAKLRELRKRYAELKESVR